jgi:hypothetical protein
MGALVFLVLTLCFLGMGLWLVRINRWPRVQVRVLKKWEEITGRDADKQVTGWLHADIEYWYESKKYTVSWKGDLQEYQIFPSALWMVVDPINPDKPQCLADWHLAAICIVMACAAFVGLLIILLK